MNEYVCINILVRLDHFLRASCIHVYVSNAPSSNLAFFSFFFLTIQANHHYRHNLCSVRPEYVHQCGGGSPTSRRHSPFIFRGASPSIHAELAYGQRLVSLRLVRLSGPGTHSRIVAFRATATVRPTVLSLMWSMARSCTWHLRRLAAPKPFAAHCRPGMMFKHCSSVRNSIMVTPAVFRLVMIQTSFRALRKHALSSLADMHCLENPASKPS